MTLKINPFSKIEHTPHKIVHMESNCEEDKPAFEDNRYLKYSKQPTKHFSEYKGLQAHASLCTKQSNEHFIFTYI